MSRIGDRLQLLVARLRRGSPGATDNTSAAADTSPADRSLLSADNAISGITEDKLGRADFARSLGAALATWRGDQSLVVGLYGEWGSGKSSIKNMVIDSFGEMDDARPQVLEFNPWQFAGQEQLFHAFFHEIGTALGRYPSPDAAELEKQWRVYEARLRVGETVAEMVVDAMPAILLLLAALGIGASVLGVPFGLWLTGFAVIAAAALKRQALLSGRIADVFKAESSSREGVPAAKKVVADLLKKRTAPLIVVLDDVDRLQPEEIRLLFQLIKANGDLPRLVYFALFQHDVVEKSLETHAQSGRHFLEKIVQVAFVVPVLEQARVDRVLFEGLDELLAGAGMQRNFDQRRWGNVYLGGLQSYFTTLRRVYRFLSTLRFHAGVMHRQGWLEVNVIDLVGIEVLRLYEPTVYQRLFAAKRFLTERASERGFAAPRTSEAKQVITALLAGVPEERTAAATAILSELFPHAASALGGSTYAEGFEEAWERELRIGARRIFDRYFFLAVPQGDLAEGELGVLIENVADRVALRDQLTALAARGLLVRTLERLEAYKEKLPYEHAVPFIGALLDIGDQIPDERGGLFSIEPIMHAARIVYWFLKRGAEPERGDKLLEAVRTTSGFYLTLFVVQLEVDAHKKKEAESTVTPEQLEELKQLAVERIEVAARDGRLLGHWGMSRALYVWSGFAGDAAVKAWVVEMLTPATVIPFLRGLTEYVVSHGGGDRVGRTRYFMKLSRVEDFVPAETVEAQLAQADTSSLGDEDRRAVDTFRETMQRRRDGKGDYDPRRSRMEED